MNITEKIQLSAEEFDRQFPVLNGDDFDAQPYVKNFLITSQKELAKEIIEEFEEIIYEKEKKGVNDKNYSVKFKAGMHAMANFILDSAERLKKQL